MKGYYFLIAANLEENPKGKNPKKGSVGNNKALHRD
jgi:hypothetical protein